MLVQEILSVFPQDIILTPPELASRYHNQWPSMAQLLADGKRVMIVSLTDYKDDMAGLIFPRGLPVCRWLEPELVCGGQWGAFSVCLWICMHRDMRDVCCPIARKPPQHDPCTYSYVGGFASGTRMLPHASQERSGGTYACRAPAAHHDMRVDVWSYEL